MKRTLFQIGAATVLPGLFSVYAYGAAVDTAVDIRPIDMSRPVDVAPVAPIGGVGRSSPGLNLNGLNDNGPTAVIQQTPGVGTGTKPKTGSNDNAPTCDSATIAATIAAKTGRDAGTIKRLVENGYLSGDVSPCGTATTEWPAESLTNAVDTATCLESNHVESASDKVSVEVSCVTNAMNANGGAPDDVAQRVADINANCKTFPKAVSN